MLSCWKRKRQNTIIRVCRYLLGFETKNGWPKYSSGTHTGGVVTPPVPSEREKGQRKFGLKWLSYPPFEWQVAHMYDVSISNAMSNLCANAKIWYFDIKIFSNAMPNLALNLANAIHGAKFGTKYRIMPNFGIWSRSLIGQLLSTLIKN